MIEYYKFREAVTIIELALWKSKIEEEGGQGSSREACRVLSGAATLVVLKGVLEYLPYTR